MEHPISTNSIEELLKIAESSTEKVKFEDTEVEEFIHECELVPGESKIPTYMVYYRYYLWKKNKRKLMSRRAFFLQFKPHFESVQTGDGRGYRLNPAPFDMTPEGYFKSRALLRRERDVRRRDKKKKKQTPKR